MSWVTGRCNLTEFLISQTTLLGYVVRVIYDASLDELLQKVWDGKRIDAAEALRLYRLPLEELGALSDRRRQLAKAEAYLGRGNEVVTYIVDRNVNYTNVCNVYCKFCAFYRVEKDDDSYVITHEEMDRKIEETIALGGTQILMQGGHHPKLSKQWYLDLLSHIKEKFPQINIHGFSPSEFIHFREVFNLPLEEIISQFVKAGLGSIPGGGGEILVDRVRQRISPLKAMSDDWLSVMDVAHKLGLASTATMMFGHVETVEERIEHLDRVRAQQDKSLAAYGKVSPLVPSADAKGGHTPHPALSPLRGEGEETVANDKRCHLSPALSPRGGEGERNRGTHVAESRWLYRVHRVDVSGGAYEVAGADGRGARIFADAGVEPDLPG